MAANVFRGALGAALSPDLFSPHSSSGPSGLADPPRPFVLRACHLDGCTISPGQQFYLRVHLFAPIASKIVDAYIEAPPLHGAARLLRAAPEELLSVSLLPLEREPGEATVRFLTPTELKESGVLARKPDFPILFRRAAARLRTLAGQYADPLTLDFPRLAALADRIQLTHHRLRHEAAERVSTRTGQAHPLGGFTGIAHYSGELRELLPILHAASLTGVGRQTVWGKGETVTC